MPRTPQSRIAILNAAETTFASKGLAGARTEEIARVARANKAMLHYYFSTKEKLYRAVLDNILTQYREQVLAPLTSEPRPTPALFLWAGGHMDFLSRHPNFPLLIQREMMGGGPRLRSLIEHFQGPLSLALRKVLRSGIRRGEFRRVDVNNMLISLGGLSAFYFIIAPVTRILIKADPLGRRLVARRRRAVFDLLTHGLLTKKGRALAKKTSGKPQ